MVNVFDDPNAKNKRAAIEQQMDGLDKESLKI